MVGPLKVNITVPPQQFEEDYEAEDYRVQAHSLNVFLRKYASGTDATTYRLRKDKLHFHPNDNIHTFFKDGLRKIDFVLVFEIEKLNSPVELAYISEFIRQLEKQGLNFEFDVGVVQPMIFVKCHLPKAALDHFALVHRVELNNPGRIYLESKPFFKFAIPKIAQYKHQMIPPYMNSSSSERIVIISKVMETVKFGRFERYSLKRMLEEGYLKFAYRVHDGYDEWPENPPYSSRQILSKYWANLGCWYKYQPLNVIKQYYGTQVGFYFAWYGFYNQMLILPSIVGILVVLLAALRIILNKVPIANEICKSVVTMCPKCYSRQCHVHPLNTYCNHAHVMSLIDSNLFFYPVFMMIWGMVVSQLWLRKEAILRLKWQADVSDISNVIRTDYKRRTKFRRISPITGVYEPYVPTKMIVRSTIITIVVCGTLILLMAFVAWGSNMLAVYLTEVKPYYIRRLKRPHYYTFASVIVICCIAIFKKVSNVVAVFLTDIENPRTEHEYNDSVTNKMCMLNLFNNYISLFYLFFAVGVHDSATSEIQSANLFSRKQCDVYGCILPAAIQLLCFFLIKYILTTVYDLVKMYTRKKKLLVCSTYCVIFSYSGVSNLRKRLKKPTPKSSKRIPFWEEQYSLGASSQYGLASRFIEIINQYGYVVLFSSVFPLGPVLALAHNVLHIRLMARTINSETRRLMPLRVEGMGTLDQIITFFTYLSIITNGFILAFTIDLGPRINYFLKTGSLNGFIHSMFSVFAIKDYPKAIREKLLVQNHNICYYRAFRHPPDHPDRYKETNRFWHELTGRLIILVVFEHLFLVVLNVISYAIPDVPLRVRQQLQIEKDVSEELRVLFRRDVDSIKSPVRKKGAASSVRNPVA